jgi:hypothetical protein
MIDGVRKPTGFELRDVLHGGFPLKKVEAAIYRAWLILLAIDTSVYSGSRSDTIDNE